MEKQLLILRQLDRQLLPIREVGPILPKQGWVRTIRKALGITIKQLGIRLQVDPSRVVKIETSEPNGAVTINTMKAVAEALGCHFVYSFVPKDKLETIVRKQAKSKAIELVNRTAHSMALEDQRVANAQIEEQINELAEVLLQKSWKHLWE